MENTNDLKTMTILFRTVQSVEALAKKDILNYGVNMTEFAALEVLHHKGRMPVQSMCQKVLIANSSMTYVLDKLEEKKYIKRIQDQNDKRTFYVELTTKGKTLADDIFPKHYQAMQKIFDILSDDEKKTLNELLKKLGYHAVDLGDM